MYYTLVVEVWRVYPGFIQSFYSARSLEQGTGHHKTTVGVENMWLVIIIVVMIPIIVVIYGKKDRIIYIDIT